MGICDDGFPKAICCGSDIGSEIKYYSDEKFKAYSLLNDAKKLLKSRDGFSLVEPHSIGYLSEGLVLNFDGISLIKVENLNNLEKLITK